MAVTIGKGQRAGGRLETRPHNLGELPKCVLCEELKKPADVTERDVLCRTHAVMRWDITDSRNPMHSLVHPTGVV